MSTPDEDAPQPPDKYWTAIADKQGEGLIWVGSEYRPGWRERVVGGDRRKKVSPWAGSKQGSAKLTEDDIPAIHLAYRSGESALSLSRKYRVSSTTIGQILICQTWRHAWDGGPSVRSRSSNMPRGTKSRSAKLDEGMVRNIRSLCRQGIPRKDVARRFKISHRSICSILSGETWSHVRDFEEQPFAKGFHCGESTPSSKLNAKSVQDIRAARSSGEKLKVIAKRFGISLSTVSVIVNRKSWSHIPDPTNSKTRVGVPKGEDHHATTLTTSKVLSIRSMFASGENQASIAKRFAVSSATVSNIVNRKTWAHVPDA